MPLRHQFHPLAVIRKHWLTSDSLSLRFAVPNELSDTFRYRAGQHLPVRIRIAGDDIRRTYSICTAESEQILDVAIRVQQDGKFGRFASETLQLGDTVDVMAPSGRFQHVSSREAHTRYAVFVAGSGITPILSILKTALQDENNSHFTVFYGNRKRTSVMFLEALLGLKNQYPTRLTNHFLLSRETSDTELHTGRLDEAMTKKLVAAYFRSSLPSRCYVCGPDTMIDAVTSVLHEVGVETNRIHSERFNTARPSRPPEPSIVTDLCSSDTSTDVSVIMDGHTRSFRMPRGDISVLDAAIANDLDLPFACKGGVCSTCRVRIVEGEVQMRTNFALQPWETQAGYVLACQSVPLTERLVLDYDQI